jgi:hypothetical protein
MLIVGLCAGAVAQIHITGSTNIGTFYAEAREELRGDSVSPAVERMIISRTSSGRNWLCAIGISQYAHWRSLPNPVNDVKAVRDLLVEKYRFDSKHVIELYDKQATRENIIKKFEQLVGDLQPNDNLFIYFAGHGYFDKTLNIGYWIPAEATLGSSASYIRNTDIEPYLKAMKGRSILVVSDACFSATVFRADVPRFRYNNPERYFEEATRKPARQVLTSGGNEPVTDGGISINHSVFAYFLLDALKNSTAPYLPAISLFETIKIPVTTRSLQKPELITLYDAGHDGGEFIFVKK